MARSFWFGEAYYCCLWLFSPTVYCSVLFFFSLTEAVSLVLHWEWKTILGSSALNSILSYFLVFHFSPNSSSYVAILFLDPSTSLPLILEWCNTSISNHRKLTDLGLVLCLHMWWKISQRPRLMRDKNSLLPFNF